MIRLSYSSISFQHQKKTTLPFRPQLIVVLYFNNFTLKNKLLAEVEGVVDDTLKL